MIESPIAFGFDDGIVCVEQDALDSQTCVRVRETAIVASTAKTVQNFSGIAADLVALHRKSIDEFFFQYGLEVVLNPSIEIERLDDNRNYCCVAVRRVEHLTNLIVEEISACSGAGSDRHNTGACTSPGTCYGVY